MFIHWQKNLAAKINSSTYFWVGQPVLSSNYYSKTSTTVVIIGGSGAHDSKKKPVFPTLRHDLVEGHGSLILGTYPFYENSYTTVRDLSRRGRNMTVGGTGYQWLGYQSGPALDFNTTAYLTETNIPGNVDTSLGSIGILARLREATLPADGSDRILLDIGVIGSTANRIRIYKKGSDTSLYFEYRAAGVSYEVNAGNASVLNNWTRIIALWNATDVVIFINGKRIGSATRSTTIAASTLDRLSVNVAANDLTTSPGGYMVSELRVMNWSTSVQEAAQDYYDPFAWYRFRPWLFYLVFPHTGRTLRSYTFLPSRARRKTYDVPANPDPVFDGITQSAALRTDASYLNLTTGTRFKDVTAGTIDPFDGQGIYFDGFGINIPQIEFITGAQVTMKLKSTVGTHEVEIEWLADTDTLQLPTTTNPSAAGRTRRAITGVAVGGSSHTIGGSEDRLGLEPAFLDLNTHLHRGTFGVAIRVANSTSTPVEIDSLTITFWCDITNPRIPVIGFVRGQLTEDPQTTAQSTISRFIDYDDPNAVWMALQDIARHVSRAQTSALHPDEARGLQALISGAGWGGGNTTLTSTIDPTKGLIIFGDKSPKRAINKKGKWTYNESSGVWEIPLLDQDPKKPKERQMWWIREVSGATHTIKLKLYENGSTRTLLNVAY